MKRRYKFWDKQEKLYTPAVGSDGKGSYTAEEYIRTHAPWAENPNTKVVISAGSINCAVFMNFDMLVDSFEHSRGLVVTDDMTDDDILQAIEDIENTVPVREASAEERIASAMEFQNLMNY